MDFSSFGTTEWLVIGGVVLLILVIIVLVAVMSSRRRRREGLQQRYGPEYDRTVRAAGGERAARADLQEREKEHERLSLGDLEPDERRSLGTRMAQLQYRFTEDPPGAVYEAGRVAADALRARGYPITEDRDLALRLLAVDHPGPAQPLRTAIEGTYGKDESRLRDTFIGVRDALRDTMGIHYAFEDASSDSGRAARLGAGRAGAVVPGAGAPAAAPAATTGRGDHALADRGDSAARDDADATHGASGAHGDHGDRDSDGRAGSDRTERLDDRDTGRGTTTPPVGAVPPPPSDRSRSS